MLNIKEIENAITNIHVRLLKEGKMDIRYFIEILFHVLKHIEALESHTQLVIPPQAAQVTPVTPAPVEAAPATLIPNAIPVDAMPIEK
jgi:hypothetical protein